MIHYIASFKTGNYLHELKRENRRTPFTSFKRSVFSFYQKNVHAFRFTLLLGTLLLLQQPLGASCIYGQQLSVETERVGNLLWWTTQSESGNETFIIQRSLNGLDFVTIGTISGAGNSYTEQTYRYWDVDAEAMRVWYRLVELDYDGVGTASPTVIANRVTPSNFLITEMEQPAVQNWFRCTLDSKINGRGSFTIRDYYGDLVSYGDINIQHGANNLTVDLGSVAAGIYQIIFEVGMEAEQVWVEKLDANTQRTRVARL
ncbi:MAG: hypothetical protein AB8G22_11875 [Saprospiraceae bacterium]